MHPDHHYLAHAPCSVGALMDPELLRRAANDTDPPFANEHPAQPAPFARWHARWHALRCWARAAYARLRRRPA